MGIKKEKNDDYSFKASWNICVCAYLAKAHQLL